MNKTLALFSYPGSKRRFMRELNDFIAVGSTRCHTFIDGFGGSGAVTANIEKYLFDRIVFNELNPRLFLILRALSGSVTRDRVLWLIEESDFCRESFFKAKALWSRYDNQITQYSKLMLAITDASTLEWQQEQWKNVIPQDELVDLAAAALLLYRLSFHGWASSQAMKISFATMLDSING